MRFMIIVKATKDSEAGVMPKEKLFADMATYHEELQTAGALLDASGLQPSSKGWRIRYSGDRRTVIDGPFVETKEIIAGYTLIRVESKEEAMEWARRSRPTWVIHIATPDIERTARDALPGARYESGDHETRRMHVRQAEDHHVSMVR